MAGGTGTVEISVGSLEGGLVGWDYLLNDKGEPGNSDSMKLSYRYKAHQGCVKSLACLPHKALLVSGGDDEMIRLYNLKDKVELGVLMQHTGAVTALAFAGSNNMLSGSADNTVCIWRVHDWQCLHVMPGHKGPVNSLAVHPSARMALSVSQDATLRLWNLVKGRCAFIRKLTSVGHTVKWSPDGTSYCIASDRDVKVFRAADNECTADVGFRSRVNGVDFVTNERVVVGSEDRFLTLLSSDGRMIWTAPSGLSSRIRCLAALPQPEEQQQQGGLLVSVGSSEGRVQIWDMSAALDADEAEAEGEGEGGTAALKAPPAQLVAEGSVDARVTCMALGQLSGPTTGGKKKRKNRKRARVTGGAEEEEKDDKEEQKSSGKRKSSGSAGEGAQTLTEGPKKKKKKVVTVAKEAAGGGKSVTPEKTAGKKAKVAGKKKKVLR